MSNGVQKQGLRQQQRSLSDRMSGMEQAVTKMLFGINQRFQGTDQRLGQAEELVQALVELNGLEDVQRIVNEKRAEQARLQSENEKKGLEEAIADGYVTPAEKVAEKSLIIGQYTDKEGAILPPGRAQLVVPGVAEQFRKQLLGQVVGFELALPDGGKFTLQEIYAVDEEKAKAVNEAKQKAAQEAATAKAAEATAAATAKAGETASADEAADTQPELDPPADEEPPATQDAQ